MIKALRDDAIIASALPRQLYNYIPLGFYPPLQTSIIPILHIGVGSKFTLGGLTLPSNDTLY